MALKEHIARFSAGQNTAPPSRLGQRYAPDRFLPEAGNTVVCHLDTLDPAHTAVLAARARLQSLPGAQGFLYTPVSSMHMTVFEGVLETRRIPDAWPDFLGQDADVSDVTARLIDRLDQFTPPDKFNVQVVGVRPTGLVLDGASKADKTALRAWRDALTVPFGYRQKAHDDYVFHMTFAYPVEWIPDDCLSIWEEDCAGILDDLVAAMPIVPLKPPAFCQFADMTRFEELRVLGR